MSQVSVRNPTITTPWLSSARNDLTLFFLPAVLALGLSTLFRTNIVANSPILLLLLLQGFGFGPFHQGLTWFHYFDRNTLAHYTSTKNIRWAVMAPAAIVVVSTICFWYSPTFFFFVYVIWTIQHIAKQNIGILLLYHNSDLSEAVVEREVEVGSIQTAAAMFSFLFLNGLIKQDGFVALSVHVVIAATAIELIYFLVRYTRSQVLQIRNGKSLNAPALAFWALSLFAFAPFGFAKDYGQGLFVALVMHWFQYVGLNGMLVGRKYWGTNNTQALIGHRPIVLFIALGALYVALMMPVQIMMQAGIDPNAWQLRIVAGLVNGFTLAHYFLDAFIWRFREQFNRQSLLAYLKPVRKVPALKLIEPELAIH